MTSRQLLSHKLRDGRYRARQFGCRIDPALTLAALIEAGWLETGNCYYCRGVLGEAYELDHKTPLQRGGAHTLTNLCKACPLCNHRKNRKTEQEFMTC
jgi:5-methylcytosine-specific restriction endonuclease McrA